MYFLTSTDKIRPFLEKDANKVIENNAPLKNKKIFNKIGHALHALNPVFKEVTFKNEVKVNYSI
jgi:phytanoyl-CoA hydroxylase